MDAEMREKEVEGFDLLARRIGIVDQPTGVVLPKGIRHEAGVGQLPEKGRFLIQGDVKLVGVFEERRPQPPGKDFSEARFHQDGMDFAPGDLPTIDFGVGRGWGYLGLSYGLLQKKFEIVEALPDILGV
jgi:hypothetical protein